MTLQPLEHIETATDHTTYISTTNSCCDLPLPEGCSHREAWFRPLRLHSRSENHGDFWYNLKNGSSCVEAGVGTLKNPQS